MRNNVTHLCTALAIAAIGVACGGRNSAVNNDRRDQSGGNRGVNQRVSMQGCMQPAPDQAQGWVLRRVVLTPPSEQPQGQDIVTEAPIPKGSWVKLAAGKDMTDDFKQYANKQVSIVGDMVSTGENTIGTAGRGGSAQEQFPSQNAMANGDAPRIAVEKVQKIADTCGGE